MHFCLTVECIASSLQFLQHCLSVFQSISFNLIRPPPPARAPHTHQRCSVICSMRRFRKLTAFALFAAGGG